MAYRTFQRALNHMVTVIVIVNMVFIDPAGAAARYTLFDKVRGLVNAYFEAFSTALIARTSCHPVTIPIARWTNRLTARHGSNIALPFTILTVFAWISDISIPMALTTGVPLRCSIAHDIVPLKSQKPRSKN
jgi:hypothetical protein